MKLSIRLILPLSALALTGCLTTLEEMRERDAKAPQISAAQERQAQVSAKIDETDNQMRALSGRIEVIENQLAQVSSGRDERQTQQAQTVKELEIRLKAYEEALTKIEAQVRVMDEDIRALQAAKAAPAPVSKGKEAFQSAESAFSKKEWKQAIVDYEAYRKSSPKGKVYAQATLKIGLSFHELGMRDEAKAFYEEVIAKYPSSPEAKKASQRLKGMK